MERTLNQETYDRFKKDIMTFACKPGEPVSAAKLADRYHVSRTPAREALVKLKAEGLVDIFPQSKSVISRINVHRARQEWFVRRTLELGMVDRFFDKVSDPDISLMQDYNHEMNLLRAQPKTHESAYRYLMCDNDYHAVSYMAAGERLAAEIISNTMVHYNRIRLLVDLESAFRERTVSVHEQLIEYVKQRDKESYRGLLKRHLDYVLDDIGTMEKLYPDYFEMQKSSDNG